MHLELNVPYIYTLETSFHGYFTEGRHTKLFHSRNLLSFGQKIGGAISEYLILFHNSRPVRKQFQSLRLKRSNLPSISKLDSILGELQADQPYTPSSSESSESESEDEELLQLKAALAKTIKLPQTNQTPKRAPLKLPKPSHTPLPLKKSAPKYTTPALFTPKSPPTLVRSHQAFKFRNLTTYMQQKLASLQPRELSPRQITHQLTPTPLTKRKSGLSYIKKTRLTN